MVTPGSTPRARVFLSYSRKDTSFVDALKVYLETCGFEIFIDRKSISAGESWETRLEHLVESADTTVCVVSRHWLETEICLREMTLAIDSGRRVLPVFIDDSKPEEAPPEIARLQVLNIPAVGPLATPEVAEGIKRLVDALNTDIDWVRQQSRLLDRTRDWEASGRSTAHLLRGEAFGDAKIWRDKPIPAHVSLSANVLEYLEASEESELEHQRQQVRGRLWQVGLVATTLVALASAVAIWSLSRAEIAEAQARADRAEAEGAAETKLIDATVKSGAVDGQNLNAELPAAPQLGGDSSVNMTALAADLNSPDRAIRLSAGEQVATVLHNGETQDRHALAKALVQQLDGENLNALSASGRFNMLYMLNIVGSDSLIQAVGDDLNRSLDQIEARTGQGIAIGTQTKDCITKLRLKLAGTMDVSDTCGSR